MQNKNESSSAPLLRRNSLYARYIKRLLDIICSLAVMTLFCWLYAVIALLVRIKLGRPVIYTTKRPGKTDKSTGKEKIFKLYKFRSMTNERDENGKLLPNKVRLTKFGRFLRASSLDELPEMYNIFKGDMSIVGPRPLAVSYLQYYTEQERHRHDVRPGLTGLAQVNGRNNLSWEEKFSYDIKYISELSFLLDIKIFFMTVIKVFRREGIGQGKDAPVSLSVERRKIKEEKSNV